MVFRRTGSVACYLVEGQIPAPRSPEFAAALESQRFQSIETSASEQTSLGWVSPSDPTGESFDVEDMDGEAGWWLRVRMDSKKLPSTWVTIHRCVAERSRGRPLTRKELRELKEGLQDQLLPRVLPSVKLIDALYVPDQKRVLLFATGKSLRDEFAKLFHSTFDAILTPADPRNLALGLPLGHDAHAYLDEVSPVRWPGANGTPTQAAPLPAAEPIADEPTEELAAEEPADDGLDTEEQLAAGDQS